MVNNFGLLARQTLSCPTADILPHGRPDHFLGDRFSRPLDVRVTEPMKNVENVFPHRERDVGTGWAVAHVNDEVTSADADGLEA